MDHAHPDAESREPSWFREHIGQGINNAGTIVGFSISANFLNSHAWIWTAAGGIKPLADLGGGASLAQAINTSGVAVGWAFDANGLEHAVRWSATGVLTDLNPPGATSEALAINDSGDVVGWVFPVGGSATRAHLWRHNGTQKDLGTLGGASSQAFAVNNALMVIGVSDQRSPKPEVAFVWTPGVGMRALGMGPHSQGLGLSNKGRSVGLMISSGVTGLSIFQGVKAVLPDVDPAKGPFSGPTSVNLCGTIVGSSSSPQPTNGNPVPAIWTKAGCD